MNKKLLSVLAFVAVTMTALCQNQPKDTTYGYNFTPVKEIACTSPKNQGSSGTCWSFAGVAFLESEAMRKGKDAVDLSAMWVVRHTYFEKALKFVRLHGNMIFSAGGAAHDVINMVAKYGIVPTETYTGLNYGTKNHQHGELDAVLLGYVKAVVTNPNRELSTAWVDGLNGILDAYFGKLPEKFTYKGAEYTPMSFAKHLDLDMNDYVSVTSFSHHPFHTQFAVEVPDNWASGLSYNLPLDEFEQLFDASLEKGYSILWATDVSESGFQYNKGYAIVPDEAAKESRVGNEEDKWVKKTADKSVAKSVAGPDKEIAITQQLRQTAFDNYRTTDDHGMLIMGLATDQNGTKYMKVKNSWGTSQLYGGYFYTSYPFALYKTTNIIVNKNSIPAKLRSKLGIK